MDWTQAIVIIVVYTLTMAVFKAMLRRKIRGISESLWRINTNLDKGDLRFDDWARRIEEYYQKICEKLYE
jgi:hypothetical protein